MYPSQKPYNPRAFKSFWEPFIRFSQVFCVSHYSTFHSTEKIGRLIYHIIFSIFHIFIMTYTLTHGLHMELKPSNRYKQSSLMFYVNFVRISGNFVTHAVAHLEPLFSRKYEEEIYNKLNEINEIFALKLNYVTNFDAIRKKYIRCTCAFFIFGAIVSFGYSLYSMPMDGEIMNTGLFLLNRILAVVIIRARRCQVAFHVNFLSNILVDLQILLKRQQLNYRPNSTGSSTTSSENIRYLRDIYSNVWLLKNLISSCFGWSFITFLLEFSFDLINSSYWAYINIKFVRSTNMIIRKFSIFMQMNLMFIKLIFPFRNRLLHYVNNNEFLVFLYDL